MGLLTPLALLGLGAIALPIAAHLLRRRDVPTRALPTIALIQRAVVASRKQVQVVDRWLLALRIAVVVLAALALAGPYVTATLAWGDGRVASVALVIDDSMSMSRVASGVSALSLAVARADDILAALPPGSEVAVVLAGTAPRVLVARTDDLALVRARLTDVVEGGARGTALREAIELAARQLSSAKHATRRVVVVSDFAVHGDDDLANDAREVELSFEPIALPDAGVDYALTSVLVTPDPTTPGELAVAVEVRSFGATTDAVTLPVAIRRGDAELARGEVAVVDGRGRTTLRVTPPVGTDPTAEAALLLATPDALVTDDRRGVLLRPAAALRVLLVEGETRTLGRDRLGGSSDAARFLARSLALAPEAEGAFLPRTVDVETFLGTNLDDVDVVVLVDVPVRRGSPLLARLARHIARGGGLLLAPGMHTESGAWAAIPHVPARVTATIDASITGLEPLPDATLLPPGPTGLEGTHATRRLALAPEADARVALRWRDGVPALVLATDARVGVLGTSVDDTWTDLPFRSGFLALAVRLVRELAPPGAMPDAPLLVGTSQTLRAPDDADVLVVLGPDGRVVERRGADLARPISLDTFVQPGAYRVQYRTIDGATREAPRSAFVIAPPVDESDPTPRGQLPTPTHGGDANAEPARVQHSLAPWVFALLGLLALLEGALRVLPSRARAR